MRDSDHRNCVFNWLCLYHNCINKPARWCELLGVKVIDPDGWRGKNGRPLEDKIGLPEFMQRIYQCTISYR